MTGLYVHVPFCLTRCGYCDFNAYAGLDHLRGRYVDALLAEAALWSEAWDGDSFASVFLGGGTPTQLDTPDLVRLLAGLRESFRIEPDAEVTTEANPDTVDAAKLGALRAAGFERISFGAQSFDRTVLASLERVHDPDSVRAAFAAARTAGYHDVNLDLIYGAEGETLASWEGTLAATVALGPEHVSAYALTVESSTPLGRQVAAGERPAPDGDRQAEMFDRACAVLGAAGYEHYEVSNWAKPGHECRHNLNYWRRGDYLGLGAGAHAHRGERRWWNVRPPEQYLETVARGERPIGGFEDLTGEDARLEEVLLRLRTTEGLEASAVDADRAQPFLDEGLLERRQDRYVVTERGMFLANELVLALT